MKEAHMVWTREGLEDVLGWSQLDIHILGVSVDKNGHVHFVVGGSGLPDECNEQNKQVMLSYMRDVVQVNDGEQTTFFRGPIKSLTNGYVLTEMKPAIDRVVSYEE